MAFASNPSSYVDELKCPLSLALPVDPVVAEDGRCYEREDIETYFKACEDGGMEIKSPIAGFAMGKRLIPAIQHRNMIENMIEKGDIAGEYAVEWKKKMLLKKS